MTQRVPNQPGHTQLLGGLRLYRPRLQRYGHRRGVPSSPEPVRTSEVVADDLRGRVTGTA